MAPSHPSPDRPTDAESRDARIEQLLLTGLDLYFAGQFEQAINVWTRVSFLERGHGRARAYIERARGAIAERQREGDELLQLGVEAFDRGDADRARELLTAALERSGPDDVAATVLERVHRLAPGTARGAVGLSDAGAAAPVTPAPAEHPAPRRVSLPVVVLVAALSGAILAGVAIEVWFASPGEAVPTGQVPPGPIAVPRGADLALARARALAAGGHLPDALRALDAIGPFDERRADADVLRAAWQRRLLELAGLGPAEDGR